MFGIFREKTPVGGPEKVPETRSLSEKIISRASKRFEEEEADPLEALRELSEDIESADIEKSVKDILLKTCSRFQDKGSNVTMEDIEFLIKQVGI
jgi:hypothetical protein